MWRTFKAAARLCCGTILVCWGLATGSARAQEILAPWEGWYAAALLGHAWTDIEFTIPPSRFSETLQGVVGGAAGGYSFHLSDGIVGAFEADITFGDLMDDMSLARHKVSLVGRLGVLVTPTTLLFGVAGIAGGQYEAKVTATTSSMTVIFDDDEVPVIVTTTTTGQAERDRRLWGMTFGGGFETQINGFALPVRFGVEYRYTNFADWNFEALGQSFSIDPDVQEVRARLIFPIN